MGTKVVFPWAWRCERVKTPGIDRVSQPKHIKGNINQWVSRDYFGNLRAHRNHRGVICSTSP